MKYSNLVFSCPSLWLITFKTLTFYAILLFWQRNNSVTKSFSIFFLFATFWWIPPSNTAWWSIGGRFYRAFLRDTKDADIGATARTSEEKKKAAELRKQSKGVNSISRGFWINLTITAILTVIFIYIASSVNKGGKVSSFDPFALLGIPPGSSLKVVKSAYRKMSVTWHPDKHIKNKEIAEAKFIMIKKAYEALTDPKWFWFKFWFKVWNVQNIGPIEQ